jgi:hypothetical protein
LRTLKRFVAVVDNCCAPSPIDIIPTFTVHPRYKYELRRAQEGEGQE